ncbi:hypothetical protein CKO28_03450 [Rhodovibrio sodomensis]|uniref:Soluble calcium-activated nucleotidase 1 n=1 Tax=Rhodovibrio sodomensis TaxID=1088 RepID=A0ABS1DB08_9PROT|nr:hypothetical protein [Rhodovibrio sodomensis]MBK1667101.1 hypothetical protein [Rhodovibrio sodomensis]
MSLARQRLDRYDAETQTYTLAIVTDEDQDALTTLEDGQQAWQSRLRYDRAHRRVDTDGSVSYSFEDLSSEPGGENQLISTIAEAGRGAEFSELVMFGKRLVAFDDRTGLVCEVREGYELIPRTILITGPGDTVFKGFKAEWATLYGDELIVGSHGKVGAQPDGSLATGHEEWVKRIQPNSYQVVSQDWSHAYRAMRDALGVDPARGYVIHEAAEWHPSYQRWVFFPRKISFEPFDEKRDESTCGGNKMLVATADFDDVQVVDVGSPTPERGVSSLKIVPGHPDEFIATKSVEIGDRTETYLFAFDWRGNLLSPETKIGDYKCEGVEIL